MCLTSYMKDSVEDVWKELRNEKKKKTKADFTQIVKRLINVLPEGRIESGTKWLEESRDYILSDWGAARLRLQRKDGVVGSSTEGHVEPCTVIKDEFQANGMEQKRSRKYGVVRQIK